MKRISCYEGSRTFFCMLVIISHIFLAFFPDVSKKCVSMGNLAVIYFFFLSGGVCGLATYKGNDKTFRWGDIFSYVIKRYFRLLPVVAISLLISTLIYRAGGYVACKELSEKFEYINLSEYFRDGITVKEGFYDAFVGAFYRKPRLNTPLWTIRYEFLWGVIVWTIMKIFHNKKYRMYIYAVLICLLLFFDIYVASMFTGMVLFDLLYSNNERKNKIKRVLSRLDFILGVLIILTVVILLIGGRYAVYMRYAFALELILLIFSSEKMQRVLSTKLLVKLSKYTFSVYATHWLVICSVVSGLINIYSERYNYMIVSIVANIIGIPLIWCVGVLVYKLWEKPTAILVSRIIKKIEIRDN